jgi:hypothetical protein
MPTIETTIILLGTILFAFSAFLGVFAANVGHLFSASVLLTLSIVALYNTLFFIQSENRS